MNSINEHLIGLNDIKHIKFDVVVIGSGMGGGTMAYSLCKKGVKVLLIEKGHSLSSTQTITGVERVKNSPNERLANGQWPFKITGNIDGSTNDFHAPLGCGLGGSTLLYGGALERFCKIDFKETLLPNGKNIQWPFSYDEIEPFYQEAESLFNVHGSQDPLEENNTSYNLKRPKPLNATDQYFEDLFKKSGFNPYHLHVAINDSNTVRNRECVLGTYESCIAPAAETGNLKILTDTNIEKIHSNSNTVTALDILSNNVTAQIFVENKIVALAAGAYFTPALLLNSKNTHWPTGLANKSDMVGRNIMFHTSDFIGIWSTKKYSDSGADKTLGLRDLYHVNNQKYGQLQSTGKSAEMGYILYFLRIKLATSILGKIPLINEILRQLLRIPAMAAALIFKEASIFASIIEDYPYPENRIILDENKPSGIKFIYKIHTELKERNTQFRALLKKNLATKWVINFSHGISLNFGHPCGTCRAGEDPSKSVINGNGKAHGLNNLYICDASFMPTSGGTNPSLTVAAFSLRASRDIKSRLNS